MKNYSNDIASAEQVQWDIDNLQAQCNKLTTQIQIQHQMLDATNTDVDINAREIKNLDGVIKLHTKLIGGLYVLLLINVVATVVALSTLS